MDNLINWVELSRYLAGNESSVSRTRCPKKYQGNLDSLMDHLKAWKEEIKQKDDTPERSNEGLTQAIIYMRCGGEANVFKPYF